MLEVYHAIGALEFRTPPDRLAHAMSNDQAFLQALRARPDDDVTRLVYADWLEERGDPRGEYLRIECELAGPPSDEERHAELATRACELASSIDPDWLAVVAKTDIELCEFKFRFQCPRKWETLTPTKNDGVRFCGTCRKCVFFCDTLELESHHAYLGHCVAVPRRVKWHNDDMETFYVPQWALPVEQVSLGMPLHGERERSRRRVWFSWLWRR